jgi:hypothetical protein
MYNAFPATELETSDELKTRLLHNLTHSLPLATARRAEKLAWYLESMKKVISSGGDPKEFLKANPNANVPDADTDVLHSLFGVDLPPDEQANTLGVPEPALALFRALFEANASDALFRERNALPNEFKTANAFAIQWVEAIQPGKDYSLLTTEFVYALLMDDEYGLCELPFGLEFKTLLATVAHVHERVLAGEVVDRKEWKAFRKAVALQADGLRSADTLTDDDSNLAIVAESAATDCRTFCGIGEELVAGVAMLKARMTNAKPTLSEAEEALQQQIDDLWSKDPEQHRKMSETDEAKAILTKKRAYAVGVADAFGRERHRLADVWIALTQSDFASAVPGN